MFLFIFVQYIQQYQYWFIQLQHFVIVNSCNWSMDLKCSNWQIFIYQFQTKLLFKNNCFCNTLPIATQFIELVYWIWVDDSVSRYSSLVQIFWWYSLIVWVTWHCLIISSCWIDVLNCEVFFACRVVNERWDWNVG